MMEIMHRDRISLKKTAAANYFTRMFYAMAAAPAVLIVEAFAKNSITASAASAVLMISIMAAILTYCWAMFKSFHSSIFNSQPDSPLILQKSSLQFVVAKTASAAVWLGALFLAIGVVLFMHITILERIPEVAAKSEVAQLVITSIDDSFGKGVFRIFSAASLFLQAIVMVSITYIAAVASHMRVFERYKALAGIFVFVLLYFFENDFAGALKRMIARGFGGIEELMSVNVKSAVGIITGIEFAVYLAITAINIAITCYFLKKLKKGESNGKGKEEKKI